MKLSPRISSALAWTLIPVVTVLVYWPAINGGLIMDDAEHITPRALQGWEGLARIWFEIGATPHYYPVLNSFFWLEHHLWGSSPAGYHVVNILQQAAAACLVVLLARRLRLPGAWLAGMIFAIHPVHVESVAWISEQKNTLSTLLALAAVLAYFRFEETRRPVHYALASGVFLLALLTKTVVAVVPPAILVTQWWQRGRLECRRDVLPLLPWFGIGAALGLFSAWFEQVHSHAQGDAFQLTLLERALIAGRAVWFYARTLAWPADLMFINPRWSLDPGAPLDYAGLVGVMLLGVTLGCVARQGRGPLATYLLFVGMLFPVLGFLNINWFNFSYVANHFQHLPSVGVIIPFAAVLTGGLERLARHAGARLGAQAVLLVTLAWLARLHAGDYRSPQTLYARTVEKNPGCWLAHNNLGALLMEEPAQVERAAQHFERALALKPDHARAHNNYAAALLRANRIEPALEHYRRSLALQAGVAEVHFHFAQALVLAERPEEALAEFARALALRPEYAEAQLGRADLLAAWPDRKAEAIAAYREAIRLNPAFAEAYNNLGSLLGGDPAARAEAVGCLTEAVRLSPHYVDARFNLAALLAAQPGREADAAAQWREVIRLRPEDLEARWCLAALLVQAPAGWPEAVAQLEAIVRRSPDSTRAHLALAEILARDPSRPADAIEHARRVLALEPGNREARSLLSRLGVP